LQSVKDFAERVDKELERLDIVVSFRWWYPPLEQLADFGPSRSRTPVSRLRSLFERSMALNQRTFKHSPTSRLLTQLSSSQVNNIANSLLSVLLLPKLQQTAQLPAPSGSPNLKPHLSIVASEVHHWINGVLPGMTENRKDTLQCFQEEALFVPKQRYPESKGTPWSHFRLLRSNTDLRILDGSCQRSQRIHPR
jgi:hypothetical protein